MAVIVPFRNKLAYPAGIKAGFDPSHPMARNCVLALTATPGPNFVNAVNGTKGTVDNTNATLASAITSLGPVRKTSGSATTDNVTFPGIFDIGGGGLTMAAIFTISGAPAASSYLVNDQGSGWNGLGVNIVSATDTLHGLISNVSFDTNLSLDDTAGPYDRPYFAAISVAAAGGYTAIVKRLDSGQVNFGSGSCTAPSAATGGIIYIGNRGAAREWLGNIAAVCYSNTLLNLPQLLQIADDPWAFWYPPQARSLVAATAVTPPTTVLYSLMNVG